MKNVKKLTSLLLVIIMIFGTLPVVSLAADVVDSGTYGDNLTWTLDSEGLLTISGSGEMWDDYLPWSDYEDSIKTVQINNGVTSIGDFAFYYCSSLTNITIPDSVTSIGDDAFCSCSGLTSITIPDSVTSIGYYAFAYCSSLTNITIPDSVTSISDDAFCSCSGLTSITIPDSVTSIGYSAFENCSSLTSITIPDSVTSIGNYAFYNCSRLTSITIPDSVTSIGDWAFYGCSSLTSITMDVNNLYYSSDNYGALFNKDKTTLIQYPAGNTRTFYAIPNSVTSIGNSAFEDCSNLTSITIPDSVIRSSYS